MAFKGLVITHDGADALAQAHLGTGLVISRVSIGDGDTNKDYKDMHDLEHVLYSKNPALHTVDNKVFLDIDISSNDASGYYFREIGVYVKDAQNHEVLYAYDNAGEDAEYISPVDSGIAYEKRLRFVFINDTDIKVSVSTNGTLYALNEDLLLLQTKVENNSPIGEIKMYAGDIAPAGYLLCQGQAISRSTYADLYKVIGDKFGSGDGSTTFNLPDMQNRVPVGASDTLELGQAGGENEHKLTVDEMPSHTHEQETHAHNASGSSASAGSHTHSASSGSGGSHTHTVSGTAASEGTHVHKMGRALGGNSGYNYFPVSSENVTGATSDSVYSAGAHTHSVNGTAASAGEHGHAITIKSDGAHNHSVSVTVDEATAVNQSTGGDLAHNNMQKYLVLNYIIKY